MEQNRIRAFLAEEAQEGSPREYYWVCTERFGVPVSREVARAIERQLTRTPPPEWLVFRDLVGSRIRVRASLIERLVESTAAQRAADRAFQRERDKEEEADGPPI